jgi:hypothetical protein
VLYYFNSPKYTLFVAVMIKKRQILPPFWAIFATKRLMGKKGMQLGGFSSQ